MKRWLLRTIFAVLLASPAYAAGTLPIVLQQQFAFTGCATTPTTAACGQPLAGGLLYFYQVGTVATRQDSFQDTGLTIANAWPLQLDQNGRVPPFYLADGSIHVRLTDSGGVVQFDYPAMLVIGPSSGGGGGASIDPTTIFTTGDIKYRPTADTISGWVKCNGLTIGSASSGATQRANADTQALYIYIWTTFSQPSGNTYSPVTGGLGASALADFNANKSIAVPDMRGITLAGLDGMGGTRANRIPNSLVQFAIGGLTADNYSAFGGAATQTFAQNQLPNVSPSISAAFSGNSGTPTGSFSGTPASPATFFWQSVSEPSGSGGNAAVQGASPSWSSGTSSAAMPNFTPAGSVTINSFIPAGSVSGTVAINGNVTQQPLTTMPPFLLGTFYIKL